MTYSILLVVEKPDEKNWKQEEKWDRCVSALQGLAKQNTDIRLLGDNTVLLPLTQGLQGVSDVVRSLADLTYKYIILTEETKWHEAVRK